MAQAVLSGASVSPGVTGRTSIVFVMWHHLEAREAREQAPLSQYSVGSCMNARGQSF